MKTSPGVWLVLGAGLLAALAAGIRPDGFASGDQGAKLAATRHVLEAPTRPFAIPLPTIGTAPAEDLVGTFYRPHHDHQHAVTPPLFPLISAPFLRLFGLRGLYVLPAVAWLAALWLVARISGAVAATDVPWAVFLAAAGTPLLFYALEFWEHLPATALTAASTVAVLRREDARHRWTWAGVLIGVAVLLRPEALCYGIALVVAGRARGAEPLRFGAGFGVAQAPIALYNLWHFGSPIGAHLSANARAALEGWLSVRMTAADTWVVDGAGVIVAGNILGLTLAALGRRRALGAHVVDAGTALVLLTAAANAWLAATRWLPAHGLAGTSPLIGLALLPLRTQDGVMAARLRFLRRVAGLYFVAAWLTAPNDGGAQWGPRYLLPMHVPLVVLAVRQLTESLRRPGWRWLAWPCVLGLALGGVWLQRSCYRDLRIAKHIHARIAETVSDKAGGATIVLSDLWWLDLLAGVQSPHRTFLYAGSPREARSAVQRLQSAGSEDLLVVRSEREATAGSTEGWTAGTCYRAEPAGTLVDRALVFERLTCRPETR